MTLSPWIIYFWGIADRIGGIALFLALLLLTVALISWRHIRYVERKKALYPSIYGHLDVAAMRKSRGGVAKWSLMLGIVLLLLALFTPSSKTIAVMVVAPAIVNSEPIQKDLPELYKAAKDALMGTLKRQ